MHDWQHYIHTPLAHWAQQRPDAIAVDDGAQALSFAQLHAAVQQRVQGLHGLQPAPATVLLDATLPPAALVCDFLATNASGRCAALGDAAWPAAQRQQVQQVIDDLNAKEAASAQPARASRSPFYIGFTSGSTGQPKGFRRHHQSWTESFRVCVESFGAAAAGRVLAPGSLSHSLFLFGAMLGVWTGGGVQLQPRFSASQCAWPRYARAARLAWSPCPANCW